MTNESILSSRVKALWLSCVLLCSVHALLAQEVLISVTVKDQNNSQPIAFAMVTLRDVAENGTFLFEQTNEKGSTKMIGKKGSQYRLQVNALGYQNVSILSAIITQDTSIELSLNGKENLLSEVVVRDTLPPISYRPDTVVYNASAFYTGRERKLKDLVDKLPGLSIDDELNITYKGEPVPILLVEDKPFFGGEPELALKGIPASAIGRIEVLEDYNPLGFSLDPYGRKQIALNVLLREEKKNVYFGETSVSGGVPANYLGRADVFRFNRKTNTYATGGINNINRELLSFKSTVRLLGGGANVLSDDFNAFNDILLQTLPPANPSKVVNTLVAMGINHTLSPRTQLNIYALLPKNDYETESAQLTRIRTAQSPLVRETRLTGSQLIDQTQLVQANWTTNLTGDQVITGHLNYNRFGTTKKEQEDYESALTSLVSDFNKVRATTRFNGDLNYAYSTEKGHIIAASLRASSIKTTNELTLNSDTPFLADLPETDEAGVNYLSQQDDWYGVESIAKFRYSHKINRRWTLVSGLANKRNVRDRRIINSEGASENFSSRFSQQESSLGISFQLQNLSASFLAIRKEIRWTPPEGNRNGRGYWLPEIKVNTRLSPASKVSFQLDRSAEHTNLSNFFLGTIIETPFAYRTGNITLLPMANSNGLIDYRYSNPLKRLVLGFRINVSHQESPQIVTAFELNGTTRSSRLLNADRSNTNWSFRPYLELNGDKARLIGRLNWERRSQLATSDNALSQTGVEGQYVNIRWRRSIRKNMDLNLEGAAIRSSFEGVEQNINYTLSSKVSAVWQIDFLTSKIALDYNFYNLTNQGVSSGMLMLELLYAFAESPWALSINGAGPIGDARTASFFQTEFIYQEINYRVLPAYLLFGATWQF